DNRAIFTPKGYEVALWQFDRHRWQNAYGGNAPAAPPVPQPEAPAQTAKRQPDQKRSAAAKRGAQTRKERAAMKEEEPTFAPVPAAASAPTFNVNISPTISPQF